MERTVTYQLLDLRLTGGIQEFVSARRAAGRSWRRISRDIYDATGIDVTYETLRKWLGEAA